MRAGGFAFLLLLAATGWFSGPALDRMNGRVTVYPLQCAGIVSDSQCSVGWLTADSMVVAASFEHQFVILQPRRDALEALDRCVVLDRLNWRCAYARMSAGVFSGIDTSTGKAYRLTSRLDWYFRRYL